MNVEMRFNSVKRGNFSNLAGSVNRTMDQVFNAARETAVDNTMIAKEAIKSRSMERRTAMEAEADVSRAGMQAFAKVKDTKNKVDSAKKINDIKRPARRMAGIVAGLGAISQAVVTNKNLKEDRAEREAEKLEWQKIWDAQSANNAQMKADNEALQTQINSLMDSFKTDKPKPSPANTSDGGTEPVSTDNSGNSTSLSSSSSSVSTNISAQHSFDPTKKMTKAQIKALAESVGFSPEAAGTVVGIAGGESGFDPTNSTRRSGLYARTGEDSVGLMQINWGYHKDSGWLQKLGITKREDLYDPVKNMKAAKYLYDGRKGGFGDWTVYNKGIYKDYL